MSPMQDVLEEIKTQGYMYTYILPIFDKKTPEYSEMQEEIDARVSYGCFADIMVAEAIDQDDIKDNLLQILAQHLEEVIR